MAVNIIVPELSESVVEATVADWLKKVGDKISVGDVLVMLETDKVTLEVAAEQAGVLSSIVRQTGDDVKAHEVLGVIDESGVIGSSPAPTVTPAAVPANDVRSDVTKATPVAQRVAEVNNVDLAKVPAGDGKRVTKNDVQNFIAQPVKPVPAAPIVPKTATTSVILPAHDGREERIRMSRRRRTIAARLVEAQQTAAMLTTFNEVDMSGVQAVRQRRKEAFKEKYGIGLGLSSFFVKATIGALKAFPRLNAEIDGDDIVLKHYYDIGIAIGAEEGLVVPVLRDADRMSFAQIEKHIRDYAKQVDDGTLPIEALRGGTFTITNGGVFGSLMSTPILNYPQVGILGLHGIKDRPVVVDGEIVIRPMMYMALTYDHRIVDGRESVQFLVKIKELIEDPESLLIEG
jgi:2-oxoglutarate dehydrogenase E2 component (dihydrolipoamide succinyltransferase)